MARCSRLLVSLVLVLPGCTDALPEVMTTTAGPGDSTSSTTSLPGTGDPTPPDGTGVATMGMTGAGTTGATDGGDTTAGSMSTSSSTDGGSTSTGPAPECMVDDECENNEICDGTGQCVEACMPWGMGTYDYCLNAYGGFDTENLCGPDHFCVYSGNPIEATACMRQGCSDACDCPGPAATGNATVTCSDVTGDGQNDCHLSCANGETCPDDMTCMGGICTTETPDTLPMYGNCGAVDATCDNGTCSTANSGGGTYSACVTLCPGGDGDCDAPPPGAMLECDGVISPPMGPDCHLDCNAGSCPAGMTCIDLPGTSDDMCMWPPL